jgi:class 3 adenylate cyclase
MLILERIEQRVALPGDSETRRTQKVLGVVLMFAGSFFTALNVITFLANGLTTAGSLYAVWVVFLFCAGLLMLAFPRYLQAIGVAALVGVILISLAGHIYSGGFQAGMETAPWMLISPIGAVMLIGPWTTVAMFVLYIVGVLAAVWLEPFAQSVAPQLSLQIRMQSAAMNLIILGLIITAAAVYLLRQVENYRRRADDLLLNILPGSIAQQLKERPGTIADGFSDVTVLFADIVDFTTMSSGADPVVVVNKLNEIFSDFDQLAAQHGLEKIKTIGDAYMVAGGLPEPRADHCEAVAAFAIDMLAAMAKHQSWTGEPIGLRVGINCGPVVAGVIGQQKFIYDLWGDAVNVASRMEANGLSNQIQVTRAVKDRLGGLYEFEEREPITVKGKGEMVTYLLTGS